jgi:hypothetical protein
MYRSNFYAGEIPSAMFVLRLTFAEQGLAALALRTGDSQLPRKFLYAHIEFTISI